MKFYIAAALAAASWATMAHAQSSPAAANRPPAAAAVDVITLDRALEMGEASPSIEAGNAGIRAAEAGRAVARLRPNPSVTAESENVAGTGPYRGFSSAETTVGLSLPIELGGKRSARIGVADAVAGRAQIDAIIARADLRLRITQAYIRAAAAERQVGIARDQLALAREGLRIARDRVQVGATSPLDEQTAAVTEVNARTTLDTAVRSAEAARAELGLLIGSPISQPLDLEWFARVETVYGPVAATPVEGTLAVVAAARDLQTANAGVQLARSQRIPDLTVSAGVRRLEATGDSAAVVGLSVPIPLFNGGRAQLSQARSVRDQSEARYRFAIVEAQAAIARTQADAANAEARVRASGPALAAATEAARIARIGYGQGKFEQIVLINAERTLAETRAASVAALVDYHDAIARLARLTTPAPSPGDTQ